MLTCQNCGDPRQEKYCPNCGEKRFNAKALTVKHLAEETFETFSHFDNRFFRSVKALITKPALLTEAYCKGITVKYMKPVAFFLVVNLIFFLLPLHNPFSLNFHNYVSYNPFKSYGNTIPVAKKKLMENRMTEKELSAAFNHKIKGTSKMFIALFVPFLALIFGLLYMDSGKRFGEHFVFATHVMTFIICLYLLQSVIFFLVPFSHSEGLSDAVISLVDGTIILIYFAIAGKRFYVRQWLRAILSSFVALFLLAVALQAYRIFLYYQVLGSI